MMRCPWCGSPVMLRGDWWECGYCGDSGALPRSFPEQNVTCAISPVGQIDLFESWENLKNALSILVPNQDAALQLLLGKVMLYEISVGFRQRAVSFEMQSMRVLEQFLKDTPKLCAENSADILLSNVQNGIVFAQEAELSAETCGTFWTLLISHLTQEQFYNREADGLSEFLSELASVYAYFSTNAREQAEAAWKRGEILREAFDRHWQEKTLLHPDVMRAKMLLAQGEFPANEDICRDILVAGFPEEVEDYTPEILEYLGWDEILEEVLERDTPKGIRMWRTLLDAAKLPLAANRETAEKLLLNWDVLSADAPSTAEAFISSLEEECFAKQIFQNDFAKGLQYNLLRICREYHRLDLEQHCRDLMQASSYTDPAESQN